MDKSIIVMDKSIILSSINGLGYKVNINELVKIYYEFDESDSSEEYLEIILKHFEIFKRFCNSKNVVVSLEILAQSNIITTLDMIKFLNVFKQNVIV